IVPETEGSTSVTFDIDMSELRRHRMGRVAMRAAAAFALVGLGGNFILPGFGVADVIALFSGGAIAGSFLSLKRSRHQQRREPVPMTPWRSSDLLVQPRERALLRGSSPVSGGE